MRDERPIVITTAKAPFHVYDVNAAWEGLCGFCRDEAKNKSVGELLQGPATDDQLAMDMVRLLKKSGFAEGTLTNYKKNGQPFSNHLLLGKIVDDDTANTDVFFIGVLQDVTTNKASTAM
jgi:PAS domain S-box-containing protein